MTSPLSQFRRFWLKARRCKDPVADNLYLASVDAREKPHVRTVLIKVLDGRGVGFVTNSTGPKVSQFRHQSSVEAVAAWPTLCLQVRLQGRIGRMPKKLAHHFWRLRPREAQILYSLGLKQSQEIPSFAYLKKKVAELEKKWRNKKTIPPAPNYVGFLIRPTLIEFLHHSPTRMNLREVFQKTAKGWIKRILAP